MQRAKRAACGGFTLVELLVVIVIIGILAALSLAAVNRVRHRAAVTRIGMEIKQLESAMEAYREKHGDYPPDFSSKQIVERHIRKAWPRISQAEFLAIWQVLWVNPNNAADNQSYVDPAEALAFWLGGFSNDARRPFFGKGGPFITVGNNIPADVRINEDRNKGTYDFEEGRLTIVNASSGPGRVSNDGDGDVFPIYLPPGGLRTPYVYFDSRTYGLRRFYSFSGAGTVAAYGSNRMKTDPNNVSRKIPEWVKPTSFQIISAGLDDHYGDFPSAAAVAVLVKLFPTGTSYDFSSYTLRGVGYTGPPGDEDNISNFSDGREFGGHLP